MKRCSGAAVSLLIVLSACAHNPTQAPKAAVTKEFVQPGTSVLAGGKPVKLLSEGGILAVGKPFSPFLTNTGFNPAIFTGKVTVINVVPSIDTPVCEEQTHLLGESKDLANAVQRVTISRDLPMAQKRFAREAKLENIEYVSDYKRGTFGAASGLLMEGIELLARAVIVVDKNGVIRHIQVVPDVSKMPDMQEAFAQANKLL